MTDRISTDELHHAALARRFYHHVLHGGSLTADDVSIMVQTIEELEALTIRSAEEVRREAMGDILEHIKKSDYGMNHRQQLDRVIQYLIKGGDDE